MHRVTIYRYLGALYKQGVVHICSYQRDIRGCPTIKIFKLGAGENAHKPPSLRTRAKINRQAREAYARRVLAKKLNAISQHLKPKELP